MSTEEAFNHLVEAIKQQLPMAVINRRYVRYVLAEKKGNKVHASHALGVDRRTIQRWAKKNFEADVSVTQTTQATMS